MSDPRRAAADEARRKAAEARAEVDAQVARAKQAFQHHLRQARVRLAHVEGRLRLWEDRRAQLAGLENDQRGGFHYHNAKLLVRMFGAMRRMLEIEAAAHQANLDAVGFDDVPDVLALRSPDDDPAYHESRRRVDLALAMFLWRMNGEGIDAVLRATGKGQAITPLDDTELALREARAVEIRAAAKDVTELHEQVTTLGEELREAQLLMDWGTAAFKRYEGLDGVGRRTLLGAPEWGRLAGKIALLRGLHRRVGPWPVLVRWFRAPDPVALPFDEATEWEDALPPPAPKGADRLDLPRSPGKASGLKLDGGGTLRRRTDQPRGL